MLEQFRISDFLEWNDSKSLKLNPDFQRGSVWTPAARIFLIDTILRDLPVPKIFIRSKIDRNSKKSIREVVDGQQRLRAIIDFASDKITLSKRAREFAGKKFSTLSEDLQDQFLQYPLAVDQLVNADDKAVLDIFSRLNSYNVKLIPPELRHAEYQGEFKWSAHEKAISYFSFWDDYRIFSHREMVRMLSDSFVAEMYGILLDGVQDGGATKITSLYKTYDGIEDFNREYIEEKFELVVDFIRDNFAPDLEGRSILKPPHLLMLFAACAHVIHGVPQGALQQLPDRRDFHSDLNEVRDRLRTLSEVIESNDEAPSQQAFWRASRASTQRIASRRVRFPVYYRALTQ
jgi:Protein of unknown function DUF262